MAGRKKKSKKKTHRRKVSGIGSGLKGVFEGVKMILATTGGLVAGRVANNMLIPATATKGIQIGVGAAEVAIGSFAAMKLKNPLLKCVAMGVGAAGGQLMLGNKGLALLPAAVGYGPDEARGYSPGGVSGYRQVPKIGFPHPGNVGYPKPDVIGKVDRERQRTARMYAGVYN